MLCSVIGVVLTPSNKTTQPYLDFITDSQFLNIGIFVIQGFVGSVVLLEKPRLVRLQNKVSF